MDGPRPATYEGECRRRIRTASEPEAQSEQMARREVRIRRGMISPKRKARATAINERKEKTKARRKARRGRGVQRRRVFRGYGTMRRTGEASLGDT